jgi:hypothetical protein
VINISDSKDHVDTDIQSLLPDIIPPNNPHYTQRRERNAAAWQEVMPSLIYPLMAALHTLSKNKADEPVDVKLFTCLSGCDVKTSVVKVISFGGMAVSQFYSCEHSLWKSDYPKLYHTL